MPCYGNKNGCKFQEKYKKPKGWPLQNTRVLLEIGKEEGELSRPNTMVGNMQRSERCLGRGTWDTEKVLTDRSTS